MKNLIFLFVLLNFSDTTICLQTYQFKVFPVGMVHDGIVTVDAQISRSEHFDKNKDFAGISWRIDTYVSIYNTQQHLISKKHINHRLIENKETYIKELQLEYNKAFLAIQEKHPTIQYFKPKEISFCEFQSKCKMIASKYDQKTQKNYINYKGKNHLITVLKDSSYYGFNMSAYFSNEISSYPISSTRVYKLKDTELIIGHFESGHEYSRGWITHDPNKKAKDENDILIFKKEHTPLFDFSDIKKAAYEEPLLHHGYGFDLFFIRKNSAK